ncbi:putative membrane protein [Shimia abyssi]|uniref:Putative membrane protein n=2 Tax=Shimia abyssi TaxID=1662395 RepID=A0A2P8F7M7_9RHOB|nr:putative membrane protein [Shimia abyssi]
MEKFIAVVFESDDTAFKGETALRGLHATGELAVYAAAVIGKDLDGKVKVKKVEDEGPLGTALGLVIGGMVGVLAGPLAVASGAAIAGSAAAASAAASGMAVGSMTGGLFGVYRDLWVAGIDSAMLDEVSVELLPGKSCVVASVDEVWTSPLDVKMGEAGGVVFRKPRIDAIDEQYASDMAELDREITELKDEWKQASDETKQAIHDKIDAAKSKTNAAMEKILDRIDELDSQTEARLKAIDEQIATAKENTRQKFETRKAEIQADYKERKSKLDASMALAKEALT